MPRIGRALSLRPVNSVKHVIDTSGVTVAGATSTTDLINTVDSPDALTNQCHVGSYVKFVFLKVEVVGAIAFAGVPRVYMYVLKNESSDISFPAVNAVGASSNKRFVIHQEMMMISQQASSAGGGDFTFPRTMFKGVLRIPKGYQRNAITDKLQFVIGNDPGESTGSTRFCLQCIYKEFY